MGDARVGLVIDFPIRNNVDAGRQRPHAQPLSVFQNDRVAGIDTEHVAAVVATLFKGPDACITGSGGCWAV